MRAFPWIGAGDGQTAIYGPVEVALRVFGISFGNDGGRHRPDAVVKSSDAGRA